MKGLTYNVYEEFNKNKTNNWAQQRVKELNRHFFKRRHSNRCEKLPDIIDK